MSLAAMRAEQDEEQAMVVQGGCPLLQYLTAIDIIKKRHFSFRLL
jgi:hypothetical protein